MKRSNSRLLKSDRRERDPSKRVLSLLLKADELLSSDLEKAATLCIEAIRESGGTRKKELQAASLVMAGKCFLIRTDLKKSEQFSKKARQIYERLGDLDGRLDAEHQEISAKLFIASEKRYLIRLHEILSERLNTPLAFSKPEGKSVYFTPRTIASRVKNDTPTPAEVEKAHQSHLAELYGTLWRAYMQLNDRKALKYIEETLAISRSLKDGRLMAMALNNLGSSYFLLKNNALAMEYLLKAIKLYHKLGHKRGEASATMNLARVYLQSGQSTLGKRLSRKSFQIFSELGMWDAQARAQISLATNERSHGNPAKATEYIAKALDVLRDHQDSGIYRYVVLQKLLTEHVIDPTRKNYQKLVRLYAEIKRQKLELRKEAASEIARIAQELHLHSEAVRWLKIVHANEIERVKNEQKNVVTSLRTQQEVERLANEREVEKLRMDKLELELKTKNRETDLLAAQLAKKGAFLTTLVEQLTHLRSSDPQHAIDRAISLIQSKQFRDSEFEQLEERVTLLHRDFLASLVQRFPSLTQAERRVCILLRVGLRPVEIAGVLFASVRTVETHCLNIRKKMGIARNLRLVHVLRSM